MRVIKVLPVGFCYGVQHSYTEALKIITNNPNKHIYFLGWLVHNRNVINKLKAYSHVSILDDKSTSRLALIEQLPNTTIDIMVLSAHGTTSDIIKLAQTKGYQVIDLTCKYVHRIHDIIKQKQQNGYHIIFIGKPEHPETIAIKEIDPTMSIINSSDEFKTLNYTKDTKLFCTNQTTFNHQSLVLLVDQLKLRFPQLEFNNEICQATKIRQRAILNLDPTIDICFIIGDAYSHNANELLKIAKQHYQFPVHLINSIQEIDKQWLNHKQCCGLVSAASTPLDSVELIAQFLAKI